MKTFTVRIEETSTHTVDVEAVDSVAAKAMALHQHLEGESTFVSVSDREVVIDE